MKYNEIQQKAKGMGIKPYKIKKTELIRLIQQTEKSMVCYGTERVSYCHEDKCLWREDCVSVNSKGISQN